MDYIIVDLEATCWDNDFNIDQMEIIEIGAVRLRQESEAFNILDEYSTFVRPVVQPVLSEYCKELTSIQQSYVDSADSFDVVFPRFLYWIGSEPYGLCSWGTYDLKQFEIDCMRHNAPFPEEFRNHFNLKALFAKQRKIKRCGMKRALQILEISHEGIHHKALSDARNIAKIAVHVLNEVTIQKER